MRRRLALLVAALLVVFSLPLAARLAGEEPAASARRTRYLDYARAAADHVWEHHDEIVAGWRKGFDPAGPFGYRGPGELLEMAAIDAWLCENEKKDEPGERAKKVLLEYGDFRAQFPEELAKKRPDYKDGVPALGDFFLAMKYVRAFETLHRLGKLSPDEAKRCEEVIAQSMDWLLLTPEWGAMNRSMLRAESLAWAVRALPAHASAPRWEMQRRALGDDNWGHWEIEDATIYHGIWLYALLGYSDAIGKQDELFHTAVVYYYAQYFLHLLSPMGIVPEFGDANWKQNWQHFLVFFEAAAGHTKDPQLAWAATQIADRYVDWTKPERADLGLMLLDAYRWGKDVTPSGPPAALSEEVLEDVQGKKVVFRDGWKPDSTYLLLDYRDEGDGSVGFRDYLRDTIPIEEEKTTHGHSDENSIPLLVSGGSLLLHDAGYRDRMPSGPFGAYRQDYFHDRLCVRPEKIFMGQKAGESRYSPKEAVAGQPLLDFLHDAGSYRPVRTRKVDFLSLPDFDYSRTRLVDEGWGYEADRAIVYVKEANVFVVFDVFKARREDYFTLASLWHTRQVLERGDHWRDTVYDTIGGEALPTDRHLLVDFVVGSSFRLEGEEPIRRSYQDEVTVYQAAARHFELAETETLVTVLAPHAKDEAPAAVAARIRLAPTSDRAGSAVAIDLGGGRSALVGLKNDLRKGIVRDDRRPRYTYEAGRVAYGDLATDGDLVFAVEGAGELAYTVVGATRAEREGRVLFQAGEATFGLAFDGSPEAAGVGKVRYWRDSVKLDRAR
jgi:hypothetical protein